MMTLMEADQATEAEIVRLVHRRHALWHGPDFHSVTYRQMGLAMRIAAEAWSCQLRHLNAEIVRGLTRIGRPVPMPDGGTVRLDVDADGYVVVPNLETMVGQVNRKKWMETVNFLDRADKARARKQAQS